MTIYKDITQMVQELANSCLAAKLNVKPHIEPNYNTDNGYGKTFPRSAWRKRYYKRQYG